MTRVVCIKLPVLHLLDRGTVSYAFPTGFVGLKTGKKRIQTRIVAVRPETLGLSTGVE